MRDACRRNAGRGAGIDRACAVGVGVGPTSQELEDAGDSEVVVRLGVQIPVAFLVIVGTAKLPAFHVH